MTATKSESKLATCRFCQQDYLDKEICQKCRERDVHHGKRAPTGKCQQCLEELPLNKEWNDKHYCKDCKD